ncbi:hypothetical protein AaE_002448 [Aphanomyces astaci]|uniref:Uncharacterized protein n=1 Tax=Aphanomyces astaci TaxID=112090 RepID=A0A6A5AFI7_APHAT|nr:hypothetical protein AaE_002448 [Aphanomyces astaci]
MTRLDVMWNGSDSMASMHSSLVSASTLKKYTCIRQNMSEREREDDMIETEEEAAYVEAVRVLLSHAGRTPPVMPALPVPVDDKLPRRAHALSRKDRPKQVVLGLDVGLKVQQVVRVPDLELDRTLVFVRSAPGVAMTAKVAQHGGTVREVRLDTQAGPAKRLLLVSFTAMRKTSTHCHPH